MRVDISKEGVLLVIAENTIESFALKKWGEISTISVDDKDRNETFYYLGSKMQLRLETYVPEVNPHEQT